MIDPRRSSLTRIVMLATAVSLWLALAPAGPAQSSSPSLEMNFRPESDQFVEATRAYEAIWKEQGSRVVATMEEVSGLKFSDKRIEVIVFEGVSNSGFRERPMRLRASYVPDRKKSTLVHELGHRLISPVPGRREIGEHQVLFLILYDAWVKLYGKEFADASVAFEKELGPRYVEAWEYALGMTAAQRKAKFAELVAKIE